MRCPRGAQERMRAPVNHVSGRAAVSPLWLRGTGGASRYPSLSSGTPQLIPAAGNPRRLSGRIALHARRAFPPRAAGPTAAGGLRVIGSGIFFDDTGDDFAQRFPVVHAEKHDGPLVRSVGNFLQSNGADNERGA